MDTFSRVTKVKAVSVGTYFLPLFCLPAVVDSPSMLCIYICTSDLFHVRINFIKNIANGNYTHTRRYYYQISQTSAKINSLHSDLRFSGKPEIIFMTMLWGARACL